jgi:hypothetical protein
MRLPHAILCTYHGRVVLFSHRGWGCSHKTTPHRGKKFNNTSPKISVRAKMEKIKDSILYGTN